MNPEVLEQFKSFCAWATSEGYDLSGGNCLDIAVGTALAYKSRGKNASVVLLLREDEEVPGEEILSHAVVKIGNNTYDEYGPFASSRWERDFNQTRRMNDEEEVIFEEVIHTDNLVDMYEACREKYNMEYASPMLLQQTRDNMRKLFT